MVPMSLKQIQSSSSHQAEESASDTDSVQDESLPITDSLAVDSNDLDEGVHDDKSASLQYTPSHRMRILRFNEEEDESWWILSKNPVSGGFKYLVLLASHFGMILFGTSFTLSLFVPSFVEEFALTPLQSTIAMSVEYLLFCIASMYVNQIGSSFGIHVVFPFFMLCNFVGMYFPSFAQQYFWVVLIYGIFTALGASGAALLSLNVLEDWFNPIGQLGFASGVSFAGVGIGGAIYPFIIDKFLSLGWRTAMQYTAFSMLFFIIIASILLQPRCLSTNQTRQIVLDAAKEIRPTLHRETFGQEYAAFARQPPLVDWAIFHNFRYLTVLFATICGNFAWFAPYYVLVPDALQKGLTQQDAALFLIIIGVANTIWRPVWGLIADYTGGIFVSMINNILQFICSIWWLFFTGVAPHPNYWSYCWLSFFIGTSGAGYDTGLPTAAEDCLPVAQLQSGIGMLFCLGFLFGSPLSGPILAFEFQLHQNYSTSLLIFSLLSGIAGLSLFLLMISLIYFPKEADLFIPIKYVTKEQFVKQIHLETSMHEITGEFPSCQPVSVQL